jgi:hypothetical protein
MEGDISEWKAKCGGFEKDIGRHKAEYADL